MRNEASYLLLVLCWVGTSAHAASFDCKTAIGDVENLVCRDSVLADLDDELARTYRAAMSNVDDRKALLAQQRTWLREIRDRCWNEMCLAARYRQRIEQLTSVTPLVSPPRGTFECKVNSSVDNEHASEKRSLNFQFKDGKLAKLNWESIYSPKGEIDGVRGFRSQYSLPEMRQKSIPGYLVLEVKPILMQDGPHPLQRYCGIFLSAHRETLYAYTVGCEDGFATSHFDYKFHQTGTLCRPL